MPTPQEHLMYCGTGILPVQVGGLSGPPHKNLMCCGTGILPVHENSKRCEL